MNYLCQLYETGNNNGHVPENFYKELNGEFTQIFISLFGYSKNLDENLYMKYCYTDDIWIEVTLAGEQQYITTKYSPELANKIRKV